jgi:hypothetical protein
MSFTTRWNWKEEESLLRSLTISGMSMAEIAEKYEVSRQRIKQVFQRLGIEAIGLKKKKMDTEKLWNIKWGAKDGSDVYKAQRIKFRNKKSFAKGKGVPFTIEFGEITWPTHCPALGLELDYFAESRQENSPSFDQIDPGVGYVKGNVQILSWRANRIKNDGTEEEHRKIADFLSALLQDKYKP